MNTWSQGREAIVWEIRFPRALLAVIVGAGLAMVCSLFEAVSLILSQTLTLISSGGAFGAIFALCIQECFQSLTVPYTFVGALVATLIVLRVSHLAQATSADRLVLWVCDILYHYGCCKFRYFLGDPRLPHSGILDVWSWPGPMGTSILSTYNTMLGSAWLLSWTISNAMTFGDEHQHLGFPS